MAVEFRHLQLDDRCSHAGGHGGRDNHGGDDFLLLPRARHIAVDEPVPPCVGRGILAAFILHERQQRRACRLARLQVRRELVLSCQHGHGISLRAEMRLPRARPADGYHGTAVVMLQIKVREHVVGRSAAGGFLPDPPAGEFRLIRLIPRGAGITVDALQHSILRGDSHPIAKIVDDLGIGVAPVLDRHAVLICAIARIRLGFQHEHGIDFRILQRQECAGAVRLLAVLALGNGKAIAEALIPHAPIGKADGEFSG